MNVKFMTVGCQCYDNYMSILRFVNFVVEGFSSELLN